VRKEREMRTLSRLRQDRFWTDALASPIDVPPTWIHGDLHARNILTRDGQISAVIDAVGKLSDATWARAKGWAVFYDWYTVTVTRHTCE